MSRAPASSVLMYVFLGPVDAGLLSGTFRTDKLLNTIFLPMNSELHKLTLRD